MTYLLDANSCIYLFANSFPALTQRVAQSRAGDLAISSIVLAEIAYGTHNGQQPPRSVLDNFLHEVRVLSFDALAAEHYARLPFRRGRFNRLLAAHALSLGAVIVTNNEADFTDVPGLLVENWTIAA